VGHPVRTCPDRHAAAGGLTRFQAWLLVVVVTLMGCLCLTDTLSALLRFGIGSGILLLSAVRILACAYPAPAPRSDGPDAEAVPWPVYTVILALYREAPIVPQLIAAIAALDYPRHRLQIIAAV